VLALPNATRCRSMCVARRTDDMRARSCQPIGLLEVQEGWDTPGCHAAPACAAPATYAAGKLNAKLKSDFRCYPNNGHAATASAGPFCARSRHMHRGKFYLYSITSLAQPSKESGTLRPESFGSLEVDNLVIRPHSHVEIACDFITESRGDFELTPVPPCECLRGTWPSDPADTEYFARSTQSRWRVAFP
jgi:hypothetical protein